MRLFLRQKQQHFAVDVRPEAGKYHVTIDDTHLSVEAHYLDEGTLAVAIDGRRYRVAIARRGRERFVAVGGEAYTFTHESGAPSAHSVAQTAPPEIIAPMPGKVLQVMVQPGDHVTAGDGLLILEAMKMENRLVAEAAGTVAEVRVAAGDMVDGGQVLVVLAYSDASPG